MDFRILQKILSEERLKPYLVKHSNNRKKAIQHYKSNIKISEAFYSPIAILEVGLRNNIDYQLQKKYSIKEWFDHPEFIKIISSFQLERVILLTNQQMLFKHRLLLNVVANAK